VWSFHVLMACTVGLELNESFNAYWVMVKKDTYMLAQKSLDVRSNVLNTECHMTSATAGPVCHIEGNLLNKCFPPFSSDPV